MTRGHILLFATNPMWRNENSGSFFLLFNAMLNYRHLEVSCTALEAGSKAGKK